MKELSILWISRYAAYDTVRHAGGQNFNFYLKRMSNERTKICMVAFCTAEEKDKIDCEKYGIESQLFCIEDECSRLKQKLINYEMRFSPFNKYGNFCDLFVSNKVIKYLSSLNWEKEPDVIILHWTEIGLLAKKVKMMFPNSKIVTIEEDVAFLGLKRAMNNTLNPITKFLKKIKYYRLKREEIKQLSYADVIFTTNCKDRDLLLNNGIKKVNVLSSYFHSMSFIVRDEVLNHIIVFYGAMNREENYKSAIWFIENVFNCLEDSWKLYIIGNKPSEELLKYRSRRIQITGFVESIAPYFERASCFVAPLLTGAGIKIKILEAMSAGVPILTNSIGIEGIPAKDKEEYLHCVSPKDYISAIKFAEDDYSAICKIGLNGKRLIMNNFNYEESFKEFKTLVFDASS